MLFPLPPRGTNAEEWAAFTAHLEPRRVHEGAPSWCWHWPRYPGERATIVTASGRRVRAARWDYQHFRGPIPHGFALRWHCGNHRCCNPWHLYVVPRTVLKTWEMDPRFATPALLEGEEYAP